LEEEDGSAGNGDRDSQEDYLQRPIQKHNTSVSDNNEPTSVVIWRRSTRGNNPIPAVTLSNTVTHETQKCGKQKKKNDVEQDTLIGEDLVEEDPLADEITKPGVSANDVESDDINIITVPSIPHELESDLGPYWTLSQSWHVYVLNTIIS
jgi:hypothetical protein